MHLILTANKGMQENRKKYCKKSPELLSKPKLHFYKKYAETAVKMQKFRWKGYAEQREAILEEYKKLEHTIKIEKFQLNEFETFSNCWLGC